MILKLEDRYRGCLLGLACGDAVGTSVEFSPRGTFPPVTDMVGGGPFDLAAGHWTDDTSMAICLAQSLLHQGKFDAVDQMNRYVNWWHWGYPSPTGECFDIGMTVRAALDRYLTTKDPMAGSDDPRAAGNGSLMRLAPVVLFYHPDRSEVVRQARLSSRTTHAALEALECCDLLAEVLVNALEGLPMPDVLKPTGTDLKSPRVQALAKGDYLRKPVEKIKGSGYCVESLEAALWCFATTESFQCAVLAAANLGDDADTTAAITGQIAGAYYGVQAIPPHWLERLFMAAELDAMARDLMRRH